MTGQWRLFKELSGSISTAEGLAIDDTLPRSVSEHGSPPILHLYTFIPSVIVGKYQDIETALKLDRCRKRGIEYNRRSTGGGTVIMGPEIVALGLGIPSDYSGLHGGVGGVFDTLGGVLIKALGRLGVPARFQPKNDLEVAGRKIAGLSAASETERSLLFHTSLLVDFDIPLMTDIMNTPLIKIQDKGYNCFSRRMTTVREELGEEIPVGVVMEAIQVSFEEFFQIRFQDSQPDDWENKMILQMVEERYTNKAWIFSHKHPRARLGVGRLKTRGGLLEVYLSLSGGAIENVMITGDFFSTTEAVNHIEKSLKWTSSRKESVESHLDAVWKKDMIYGLDVPTLTKAIMLAKENQIRL